jgi:hypothetical protein
MDIRQRWPLFFIYTHNRHFISDTEMSTPRHTPKLWVYLTSRAQKSEGKRHTSSVLLVSPGVDTQKTRVTDSPRSPDNPTRSPLSVGDGDCTGPSWDCVECYNQTMFLTIGSAPEDDINNPDMWFSPYMPRNKVNVMNMFSDPHEWSQILSIHSPHCGKYLHQYETVLHHQRDHQGVTLGRVYTSRELQRCDYNHLVDLPWRLVHKSNKLLNFSFNDYRFMTRLGSLTVFMMRYCSSTCDYTTKNNLSLALVISTSCISYDHLRFCNYWIYLSRRQLLTLHMLLILWTSHYHFPFEQENFELVWTIE